MITRNISFKICIFFIINCFTFFTLFSQNIITEIKNKNFLDLYILESEFNEGKYIAGNLNELNFKKYDGKALLKEKEIDRRMYTFRGEFFLDKLLEKDSLSLYIYATDYPFNVYLNGNIIYKAGRYNKNYNSTIFYCSAVQLSNNLLNYGNIINEIAIQIYPKNENYAFKNVFLSSYDEISRLVFWQNFLNINLIQGSSIISLLLFLYFLFLSLLIRLKNIKYIFFSLMCLFFCLSYFNINFFYNSANEVFNEKIARGSLSFCVMFLMFFIIEHTSFLNNKKYIKKIIFYLNFIISITFFTFIIFQKDKSSIDKILKFSTNIFISPMLLFSLIVLIKYTIKSISIEKNYIPLIILSGYFFIIITSIHDIYYVMKVTWPFAWLIPYGYLLLVISIFFTLSIEQSKIYFQAEKNLVELNVKNESLKILAEESQKRNELLTETIKKSHDIIINLNINSKEIETAAQKQANGASDQASDITEVSATLEELTITAKQITKNVSELVNSSETAIKSLHENKSQLLKTVSQLNEVGKISSNNASKIGELGKRSALINEMVELIKDIANKTNILSINASIEASRSGESGTGFSVVAAEIRELSKETITSAKNVEKAAKEIQDFLNSIIITSESESNKVIDSGKTLKVIYDNIENIVLKINNNYSFTQKIDTSIKQQENGSKQASDTMKQMAEIARQSVETARETLMIVENIVNLSKKIEEVLQQFKYKK